MRTYNSTPNLSLDQKKSHPEKYLFLKKVIHEKYSGHVVHHVGHLVYLHDSHHVQLHVGFFFGNLVYLQSVTMSTSTIIIVVIVIFLSLFINHLSLELNLCVQVLLAGFEGSLVVIIHHLKSKV